jgi:crossover junction endodeoxyribonuclease RuvC
VRVLGIDPGLNNVGFAILESAKNNSISYIRSGVIKTSPKDNLSIRLYQIFSSLDEVISSHDLDIVCIEEVFINMNAKSSMLLSFARGAILTSIGKYNLQTLELAPNFIKKTVVGSGRADKMQIQKMISMILPSAKYSSADEADAIAIAYSAIVSSLL